jgi:hypothetical protein
MRLLTNTFKKCFCICIHRYTQKVIHMRKGHSQRAKVSDGNITVGVSVQKLMNSTEFRWSIMCRDKLLVSDLKYSVL